MPINGGPPSGATGSLERALEQIRRTLRALSDEMSPIGPGWTVRTHSLPLVWTLNQLRLNQLVTFAEAVAPFGQAPG